MKTYEGPNRIDRICTNPALIDSVMIQDERDAIGKGKAIDRIVKYDHQLAVYSRYKPPVPLTQQQLDPTIFCRRRSQNDEANEQHNQNMWQKELRLLDNKIPKFEFKMKSPVVKPTSMDFLESHLIQVNRENKQRTLNPKISTENIREKKQLQTI